MIIQSNRIFFKVTETSNSEVCIFTMEPADFTQNALDIN